MYGVPRTPLRRGDLREHTRLGSNAVYRVLDFDGEIAHVEVVFAPGLRAGQRLRLDVATVRQMALVRSADEEAGSS
jgi:hypothetical protein